MGAVTPIDERFVGVATARTPPHATTFGQTTETKASLDDPSM
jgi:hypothetical protein